MKIDWMVRNRNSERLLMMFHGWSRDAGDFARLAPGTADVAVFSNYAGFDIDPADLGLDCYGQIDLAAWSLGVWAAAYVCGAGCWGIRPARALAINGTLRPLSAEYGIAPEIFLGTAAHWLEPAARHKFSLRMGIGNAEFPASSRTAADQQHELYRLSEIIAKTTPPENIFDRALVGERDRIMPAAAQLAAWRQAGLEPQMVPGGSHWCWDKLTNWDEVMTLGERS